MSKLKAAGALSLASPAEEVVLGATAQYLGVDAMVVVLTFGLMLTWYVGWEMAKWKVERKLAA